MFTFKQSIPPNGGELRVQTSAQTHKRTSIKKLSLLLSLILLLSSTPLTSFANVYEYQQVKVLQTDMGSRTSGIYRIFRIDVGNIFSASGGVTWGNNSGVTHQQAWTTYMDSLLGAGNWQFVGINSQGAGVIQQVTPFPENVDISRYVIFYRHSINFNDPAIDSNNQQTATLTNTLNSQTTTIQTNLSNKATEMLYVASNNKTILSKLGIPLTASDGGVYTTNGGVRVQVIFYSTPTNLDQLSLS